MNKSVVIRCGDKDGEVSPNDILTALCTLMADCITHLVIHAESTHPIIQIMKDGISSREGMSDSARSAALRILDVAELSLEASNTDDKTTGNVRVN